MREQAFGIGVFTVRVEEVNGYDVVFVANDMLNKEYRVTIAYENGLLRIRGHRKLLGIVGDLIDLYSKLLNIKVVYDEIELYKTIRSEQLVHSRKFELGVKVKIIHKI